METRQAATRRHRIAALEAGLAIAYLAFSVWALPGSACTGRPFGHDCEGWFILTTFLFAPFGVLALICSIWGLQTRSAVPHVVLLVGLAATTVTFIVINGG